MTYQLGAAITACVVQLVRVFFGFIYYRDFSLTTAINGDGSNSRGEEFHMSILWVVYALFGSSLVVPNDLVFSAGTFFMSALIAFGDFALLWMWAAMVVLLSLCG